MTEASSPDHRARMCCAVAADLGARGACRRRRNRPTPASSLTSSGIGNGGNLGGLAGADNHCQTLAQAAGRRRAKTWRAYLSTQAADGQACGQCARPHRQGAVAERQGRRDRQGCRRSAQRRQQPHQADRADREGRGHQRPRRHAEPPRRADGLAGRRHGLCGRRGPHLQELDELLRKGSAMVGHFDRIGLRDDDASKSWNSSHPSRGPDGGCSQADLKSTGGDGLLYCFAANWCFRPFHCKNRPRCQLRPRGHGLRLG